MKAFFEEDYTDCSETNISVPAGTSLPIISFESSRIQCLAEGKDGRCPIWVPRHLIKIEK